MSEKHENRIKQLDIIILSPTGSGLAETLASLMEQSMPARLAVSLYIACPDEVRGRVITTELARKLDSNFRGVSFICRPVSQVEEATLDTFSGCLAAAVDTLSAACRQSGDDAMLLCCREGTTYSRKAMKRCVSAIRGRAGAAALHTKTLRHTSSGLVKILHNPYEELLPVQPQKGYVDIESQPQLVHTAIDGYVFGEQAARLMLSYKVDIKQCNDALHFLTLRLLENAGGFEYIADETCRIALALENSPAVFADQHAPWWYLPSVINWRKYLEETRQRCEDLPAYAAYAATHQILSKIKCNFEDKDKGVLAEKADIEAFYTEAARALCMVDNEMIVRWSERFRWTGLKLLRNVGFHRCMLMPLMRRKAEVLGGEANIGIDGDNIVLDMPSAKSGDIDRTVLCRADSEEVEVNIINYEKGMLVIDGTLTIADLIPQDMLTAYAVLRGADGSERRVSLEHYPVYPLIKCFGKTVAHKYNIHLSVPADKGTECRFEYELAGHVFPMKLVFCGGFSRLVTGVKQSYWRFDRGLALTCPDGRKLKVTNIGGIKAGMRELSFQRAMLSYKGARKLIVLAGTALRILYRLTSPFRTKKLSCVTFDKLYKAGDNGDYFFRYACGKKELRTYYILDRKAKEYHEMKKKYGSRVLPSFSVRAMFRALSCDVIAATHSTVLSYLGFPKPMQPFFRDLFGFKIACIQHGLTVQQIAQYQNRVFDNTTLYCLASPVEYDNVMLPIFGYSSDRLRMTGLARFDGLVNDDKRFILITPTWRRNVVNGGIAHIKKSHSETFKDSEYFRLYNGLINDARLIATAKRCGYGITYLLHPAMSAQINDFDRNDYVNMLAATGDVSYEKILTQASLMVTDYSGVQFDIAYMRKPIVYYHPDTLPPQYVTDSFNYTEQGFGEICRTHEQLVNTLCMYMENECRCSEKYISRADSFFSFSDHKNCERIYKEILDFARDK